MSTKIGVNGFGRIGRLIFRAAAKHPDVVKEMDKRYQAWHSELPPMAKSVRPPKELLPHTANGNHARRPFGRGFMTVEKWDKIKDDYTQWSEYHVRKRMLEGK